jgi:hypothetical protein
MAIFGLKANYEGDDVSGRFIRSRLVGIGWSD